MRRRKTYRQLRKKGSNKVDPKELSSQSETMFLDMIEAIYKIRITRQFKLGYRYYDGQYGKILLELDGERWHRSDSHKKRDALKDSIAKRHGFTLYRIPLNRIRDIPKVIAEHRQLLDKIFSNGHS